MEEKQSKLFTVVYQDKALNRRIKPIYAESWEDVIRLAFTYKDAKEKLLTIDLVSDPED